MSATALRPLQNPTAASDIEVLIETIARCRRRARFVLFARYAAVAFAISVAVAAAAPFVSQPLSWAFGAVAVCAGVAGSAVVAVWRCPSLFQIAAEIDRRYHLDDSVVAAIQVHGSGTLVAPLVVRNAITRARRVDAAVVFPLAARRHAVAVAIATSLLLVTALPGGSPTAGTRLTGRGMAGEAVSGSPTADSPRELTSDDAPSAARATADALSARTPQEGAAESGRERRDDSRRSPNPSAASTSRTPPDPTSAPSEPRRSSSALPVEGQPGVTRPASSADGIVRDAASGLGAAGRGGSGSGGSGASGVGRGTGAGGVRGGALINAGTDADAGPRPPARYAGRYVQGGRAEAAVTHDDVPPDLRAYVRDYFAAIAPAAERK